MTNTATTATTTLVFIVEGEPSIGTVGDYAKALEGAHYAGLDVSRTVWTVDSAGTLTEHTVHTHASEYDENDYSTLYVEVELVKDDPEMASVRIDGRS